MNRAPQPSSNPSAMAARVLPRAGVKETLRLLGAYSKPQLGTLLLSILFLLISAVAALAVPLSVGVMVDVVSGNRPVSVFGVAVLILAASAVVGGVLSWLGGRLVARFAQNVLAELRQDVTTHSLKLPLNVLEKTDSGDLVSRVSGDVAKVAEAAEGAIAEFILAAFRILSTLFSLAVLDCRFALAGLIAIPVQAFALRRYLLTSSPVYAQERLAEGARSQEILQSQNGYDTAVAYGVREHFLARITASSLLTVGLARLTMRINTRFYGRLNLAEYIGLGAILGVGYWLFSTGSATLGAVSAAALFFSQLFNPLNTVLGLFDVVQQAGAGLTRLAGVLSVPLGARPLSDRGAAGPDRGAAGPDRGAAGFDSAQPGAVALDVKNLAVEYHPDRRAIEQINLVVRHGQRVAIVGTSGAGKSTLGAALAGEREPAEGTINFYGTPLAELGEGALRRVIAEVNQQTYAFAGTLRQDLTLAAPHVTDAELTGVLDTLGALTWVTALPEGLDTVIGDGGHQLTGAQKQHLALVRLALLNPRIIILDEATAEDSPTSRSLESATDVLTGGRTAVVIAHRLSQAEAADEVLVMEHGRITQHGTHAQLLTQPGRYAQLWAAQRHE